MNSLRVQVSQIGDEGVDIDVSVPAAELTPEGAERVSVGVVRVSGALTGEDLEFEFIGSISGAYAQPCDRCLEPAVSEFMVDVMWAFARTSDIARSSRVDEDDIDFVSPFLGNEIDLSQRVWEEVVLATPSKFLCKADCRGVCAACGVDLNKGSCSCLMQDAPVEDGPLVSNQFAGLKDLFPNLKFGDSKE